MLEMVWPHFFTILLYNLLNTWNLFTHHGVAFIARLEVPPSTFICGGIKALDALGGVRFTIHSMYFTSRFMDISHTRFKDVVKSAGRCAHSPTSRWPKTLFALQLSSQAYFIS